MRDMTPRWIVIGLLAASRCALAQQSPSPPTPAPPAHTAPRPQDLEPGVNTSAPPPPDTVAPASVPSASGTSGQGPSNTSVAPKVGTSSVSVKPTTATTPNTKPSTAAKPAANAAATAAASNSAAKGSKEDRLQLDTTQITGNQELPKVLYIVPWKRADLGDLLGKPPNTLLDEVLQPVDRDVFKRENRYYDALKPDAGGGGDKAAGAAGQVSGDKH